MERRWESIDEVVEEMMRIHRSLAARAGLDEVEAARALVRNVEKEEQARVESISRQTKSPQVPEELFSILVEMQKNLVHFQSKEEKREALKLLDLENVHSLFDDLIQRASNCLPSSSSAASTSSYSNSVVSDSSFSRPAATNNKNSNSFYNSATVKEPVTTKEMFTRDDSYVKKAKSSFYADGIGVKASSFQPMPQIVDSTLKSTTTASGACFCYFMLVCILVSVLITCFFRCVLRNILCTL